MKEIDARQRKVKDYTWEDLRTITLNLATERWLSENVKILLNFIKLIMVRLTLGTESTY